MSKRRSDQPTPEQMREYEVEMISTLILSGEMEKYVGLPELYITKDNLAHVIAAARELGWDLSYRARPPPSAAVTVIFRHA